ncbi:unnamed protein product, partial [marine sediment metagenome]
IVFHLRPGVYFNADHVDFMESREVIADDAAYCLTRWMNSARCVARVPYVSEPKTAYAEGRYKVVIETDYFDYGWYFWVASSMGAAVLPPEVVEAGAADWKNQVATGPFIIGDVVKGSQVTYKRNPIYWDTTTIDGEEYPLPFVDKLVIPVIADEATLVSAVRTGKLDAGASVPVKYGDTLAKTCPELVLHSYTPIVSDAVFFQCREGFLLQDKNLRRALTIGTDRDAIVKGALDGIGLIHSWIDGPGSTLYTPIEEMPESVQELYQYDLVK